MTKKDPMSLNEGCYIPPEPPDIPDAPVNTVVKAQTPTTGHKLEIGSRITNRNIADALQLSYTMVEAYHSSYVAGKKDLLLRMAISKDGLGRSELIDTLKAGGSLPDSYYDTPTAPSSEWEE